MLSAAEAAMDQAAEDDAERARNRARVWAPPKGHEAARQPGQGAGMSRAEAQALMSRLAAEDARLGGARTR